MNEDKYQKAEDVIYKLDLNFSDKELLKSVVSRVRRLETEVERLTRVFRMVQEENVKYQNFAIALKEILPED